MKETGTFGERSERCKIFIFESDILYKIPFNLYQQKRQHNIIQLNIIDKDYYRIIKI